MASGAAPSASQPVAEGVLAPASTKKLTLLILFELLLCRRKTRGGRKLHKRISRRQRKGIAIREVSVKYAAELQAGEKSTKLETIERRGCTCQPDGGPCRRSCARIVPDTPTKPSASLPVSHKRDRSRFR